MCVCAALDSQLCRYLFVDDKVMKVQGKAHTSQAEEAEVLRKMHDLGLSLELCGVIMHEPLSNGSGCKRTSTCLGSPNKVCIIMSPTDFSCPVPSIYVHFDFPAQ